jgi:hypothetical protein
MLPRSPQLCPNGGLSVLSSIRETEKSRVGGGRVMLFLVKKFPGENGSVRWCVVVMQQPVFLSSTFGACLRTFSRSRRKTSQQYAELNIWPARTNSFEQSPWCQRKWLAHSWLCSSSTSPFFGLGDFELLVYDSCFLPPTASASSVSLFPRFAQNLMLFLCRAHREIASGQIHDFKCKKSPRPASCVKFCALTSNIW